MIIAVDFDGTLKVGSEPNLRLIQTLRVKQVHGAKVILWTCREGKALSDALLFLGKYGFKPNYVNQNAPEAVAMLKRDPRKVYADVYIEDKAVGYIK